MYDECGEGCGETGEEKLGVFRPVISTDSVAVYKNRMFRRPGSLIHFSSSLITSSTNGFDGSMMNGLQSLNQWKEAFNNPSNSMLGLLNAIQVCHVLCG